MLRAALALALVLVATEVEAQAATCVVNGGAGAGTSTCTWLSGPWAGRFYRLHIPVGGAATRPLVVLLHGLGNTPDNSGSDIRQTANLETRGDAIGSGVVIAYPQGVDNLWNMCPEACAAFGACQPDIDFVNVVIADIKARTSVNAGEVALAGFSGGAFLTLRMFCEAGANVHATVGWSIEGSLTQQTSCVSTARTRLIMVNGGNDLAVVYTGGNISGIITEPVGRSMWSVLLNVRGVAAGWTVTKNGLDSDNECRVIVASTTPSTTRGSNLTLWTMGAGTNPASADGCNWQNGMGHRWPGGGASNGDGKPVSAYDVSVDILASVTGG